MKVRGGRGRPDGLVGVLRILLGAVEVGLLRHVIGPVLLADELPHLGERLLRHARRVGSHVGNQTDGADIARQLDAFVELLRDHHRLLDREARRLLQLAGDERRHRPLLAFLGGDRVDGPRRAPQIGQRRVRFLLVRDLDVGAVPLQQLGVELGRLRAGKPRPDVPVLLGDEPVDFRLAIAHQLQGDGLHPAGAETTADLVPEERADLVADQAVEHAPGLLRVDHLLVDLGGMLERREHALLRDLVEHQPADLLLVRPAELFREMPADGLPFAVRVGRHEDRVGVLGGVLQLLEDLLAAGDDLVGRLEALLDVDAELALRQVADVSHRRDDLVVPAEILVDGLRLRRRLHHDE